MGNYDYAKDVALLQSALSATSTYPSSFSQSLDGSLEQTYGTPTITTIPKTDRDLADLSPQEFKNLIDSLNEKYYKIAVGKQQSRTWHTSNETVSSGQREDRARNDTSYSVQPMQTTTAVKTNKPQKKHSTERSDKQSIRVSLPPILAPVPTHTQQTQHQPTREKPMTPASSAPLPMIGLFGRVPVAIQPSPYQFSEEHRERLLKEHAEFVRKQKESAPPKIPKAVEMDRITSIGQILRPVVRGIQEAKDDLLLELNFEIKGSHLNAEPRRYHGPALVPADLTLDDQKAVVHFLAYFRTTPLPEIDPKCSWLDFRGSNQCEKIQKIVNNLYKSPECQAIKESLKALRDAKARKARMHRQLVVKSLIDARQQITEQEDAAKLAMEKAISEAKFKATSSIAETESYQASPRIFAEDLASHRHPLGTPVDLLGDTPPAIVNTPNPAGIDNVSSGVLQPEICGSEIDLLPPDNEESEESVTFVVHPDENQLVDFSEAVSPKNTSVFEFAYPDTLCMKPEPSGDNYEQLKKLDEEQPDSTRVSKLSIAKTDGLGNCTYAYKPSQPSKPTATTQKLPVVNSSDCLIDFDTVEESVPVISTKVTAFSPPTSEHGHTKPLIPSPKVNLLDAYKKFVGKRNTGDSVDVGIKLSLNLPKAQPSDTTPEDTTLVATECSISPPTENSEVSNYSSVPQPIEVKRTVIKSGRSLTPKAAYLDYRPPSSSVPISSTRNPTPVTLDLASGPRPIEPSTAAYFRDIYSVEAQKLALAAIAPTRAPTRNTATTQAYPPSMQDSTDMTQEQPTFEKLILLQGSIGTEGGSNLNVREWLKKSAFEEAPVVEDIANGVGSEDEEDSLAEGGVGLGTEGGDEDLLIVF